MQTTWECTNPNCETRKKGSFIISSQPSYARVLCEECGAAMQIASSGPHTKVFYVGQMPETVLSAGALPIHRAKQGFWGRLSRSPAQATIDDPDIASYPEVESACRNPLVLSSDLYGWLQSSYLFLVRSGSLASTLIVVRCPSHAVPAAIVASSPVGVHIEAHSIEGYQVFGIYPLVWHGHPDFWNCETRVDPYDMIGANEKELGDPAQRYSWRKMFYLLTQENTKVLFIDERHQVVACKPAARYPGQSSDYGRLLEMLKSCPGKQIRKQEVTNLTFQYNREVDIDAVRARVRPLQ
jgi:hypothetical protein